MSVSGLRLEVVRRFAELPVDRQTWNAIAERSETNTIFQTYEWFSSWCRVFEQDNDFWLVLAYKGNTLVGIVPLVCKNRRVRFASERHADYCDVIAADDKRDVIHALFTLLAEHAAAWDAIALHNIPDRSSTVDILRDLAAPCGLRLLVRGNVACPAIRYSEVRGGASALLRKDSLQRPFRHFGRDGQLTFRSIEHIEDAQRWLPVFFAQHIERWNNARHSSLFQDSLNKRFYEELVREMLPTGRLVFSMIEHEAKPIAFHIGFSYANTFLWYKPSFDFRLRRHSPGNLMLRFLLQDSIARHDREFDFTVGDEPFKRRYANVIRHNTNVLLASKLRPYATARLWLAIKRIVRFVSAGRL